MRAYGWRDFHYLIELVVEFKKVNENLKKKPTSPICIKRKNECEKKLYFWIKLHYEDNGIDDRVVKELF